MEYSYADLAFDRGRVRIHLCKRRSFVAKVDRINLRASMLPAQAPAFASSREPRSSRSDICRWRARGERGSLAFSASLV